MRYISPEYVIETVEVNDIVLSSRISLSEKDSSNAGVSMSIFDILGL